ncbi:hypothetical protein SK128_008537 [Halocaridina rubra]|uniref:Uncharacterized protein n=1 Tax=Halocaridina rubra TaxID=373956 RepID=A0AAN9A396_HALRR
MEKSLTVKTSFLKLDSHNHICHTESFICRDIKEFQKAECLRSSELSFHFFIALTSNPKEILTLKTHISIFTLSSMDPFSIIPSSRLFHCVHNNINALLGLHKSVMQAL